MNPLPENTILVSMDVTSLYTNIPHEDGIAACKEVWDKRAVKTPPTECLIEMLTLVLKHNNFTFNGEHYLQINGTAMGTKMAPSYANIFMGRLEKQLLETSIEKPLSWYRFIDDVDMKWIETEENLENFIIHANSVHPTIKFTHEISKSNITFLDTTSTLSNGVLSTDIYSKPTDTHQYLSPKSCHPKHCTKGIPYSQALRIKRICSTPEKTKRRLGQLCSRLKKRGYKHQDIRNSFNRAEKISRNELLQYKEKNKQSRVPCVLSFHPSLKNVSNIIREHWKVVENNTKLSKMFPNPPVMAFRKPNSLKNLLVRAEISHPVTTTGECRSCGDKRCKTCKQLQHTPTFTSKTTGRTYNIFCNVSCKTSNVIYMLECSVCGLQYVGESIQPFHKRMNGHRSDIKKKPLLPVSQHMLSIGHKPTDFDRMKVTILEHKANWTEEQRRSRETFWIKEMNTLHPRGINKKQQ